MLRSVNAARRFIEALELPEFGPRFEGVEDLPDLGDKKMVAVGGQLAEFSDAVSGTMREAVSNSMLLAQLAADKAAKPEDEIFTWYDKYISVLRAIGWRIADAEDATHVTVTDTFSVHKAIIPVIATALGPSAAAASLIVGALNGLQEMDVDQPWIALFDRNSRHVHGAKFQVSHVDVDPNGDPRVTLLCFAISAGRTITQVLFFKFSDGKIEVRESSHELQASQSSLPADAIAARVRPFLAENVAAIEI